MSFGLQAAALKENRPVLVVGTPGRLAELSRQGALATHHTCALVLDEVDQLLAPHFREDLSRILEHTGARHVAIVMRDNKGRQQGKVAHSLMQMSCHGAE